MGCDIHIYGERKIEGEWKALDNFSKEDGYLSVPYKERVYNGRNYTVFGVLAGVREETAQVFDCKGFPEDPSEEVKEIYKQWECDAHSASHLLLSELLAMDDKLVTISGMKDKEELRVLFEELKKEAPDYDKLYPYCKSANIDSYESFSVQIPMLYMIADFVDKVKVYFTEKVASKTIGDKKLDPEDYRLVFWFDN